jgi:cytidine deaminase
MSEHDALIAAATQVRENAHAKFSNFKVGAALHTPSGKIFAGCNIENATYGLTVCAERVAVWKAMSEGARRFLRIAVAADSPADMSVYSAKLTPPCGACRQILWEFCGDIEILLVDPHGASESLRLKDLFPRAFDATFL